MPNAPAPELIEFASRKGAPSYRFFPRLVRSVRLLYRSPIEHMLHPTRNRMLAYGWGIFLGHPFFWYLWTYVYPDNWESASLRALASLTGLPFALGWLGDPRSSERLKLVFTITTWIQFPFTFTFLYLANPGSHVWLGTAGSTIVIYCMLVDWRVAFLGGISGSFAALFAYNVLKPWLGVTEVMTMEQFIIDLPMLGFAASIGLILSMSSANLRLENLQTTMVSIGVMAHELRTPLSTADLIASQLTNVADRIDDQETAAEIRWLANDLKSIGAQMNHQIDTQILNTRQFELSAPKDLLTASEVVTDATSRYPFKSDRHHLSVRIEVKHDFAFIGNETLMRQVLHNLLSNAVKSLIATGSGWTHGSIQIVVDIDDGDGLIFVADCGSGIPPHKLKTLFQPFSSSSPNSAHGLGLSFCERAVRRHRGRIEATSPNSEGGATFIIRLPIAPTTGKKDA